MKVAHRQIKVDLVNQLIKLTISGANHLLDFGILNPKNRFVLSNIA